MTKSQVVSFVAERVGLANRQVAIYLDSLVALAKEQCQTEGEFVIPGLGKIVKVDREARMGRDQDGQAIQIPAKTLVKFRLCIEFKNAVAPRHDTHDEVLFVHHKEAQPSRICPVCKVLVRDDRLEDHLEHVHPPPNKTEEQVDIRIPVEQLSFRLLPPGTWNIQDVINHYRREAGHHKSLFEARAFQPERIEQLNSLEPSKCYVGTELWNGYIVFEFSWSRRVVLECPFEGNAIYVLSGDWKKMVRYTKFDIRTEFAQHCTRIIHKTDWLARVKAALRASLNVNWATANSVSAS